MSKIQKNLNFTCQECFSVYQLLEQHEPSPNQIQCVNLCLPQWKSLLHSHFQEQIILYLAQQEAQKDQNHHDMTKRNDYDKK